MPGRDHRGGGRGGPAAEGVADTAGACGRHGQSPGRPGPTDAQGDSAGAGSEWVWPAKGGGPGRHLLRAGARAGASLSRALPTAVSHFLGILPLVFIALRRKLGLKKKKRRRKGRIITALILQERRTAPAPWKDNLPLFPDTWGVVYFLLRSAACRALPASPERGLGCGTDTRGCVSVGTRTWCLLPACREWVSKPRTPALGLGWGDLAPGLGHPGTPSSPSCSAPAFQPQDPT